MLLPAPVVPAPVVEHMLTVMLLDQLQKTSQLCVLEAGMAVEAPCPPWHTRPKPLLAAILSEGRKDPQVL